MDNEQKSVFSSQEPIEEQDHSVRPSDAPENVFPKPIANAQNNCDELTAEPDNAEPQQETEQTNEQPREQAFEQEPAQEQTPDNPEQDDSPTGETPAEDAPTGETPAEDAPIEPFAEQFSGENADMQPAPQSAPPVRKERGGLRFALLGIVSLILAAAVVVLILVVLYLIRDVNNIKKNMPSQNYIPIYLEATDDVSANLDVVNVASVCSPSVVMVYTDGTLSGSGVIYTSDGYIITNYHVIESSSSIHVVLNDSSSYRAAVVGYDADNDLALLRIRATGLLPATLGDSDNIKLGQLVVAIGTPLYEEFANTVTDGIVSALERDIRVDGTTYRVMQISCAINPGNSGGGCFNAEGKLIGIVNAKVQREGVEGLGFAIPVNTVKKVIEQIKMNDNTTWRKSLGVTSCYEINEENYSSFLQTSLGTHLSYYEKLNGSKLYGLYIVGDGGVEYVDKKNTLSGGDYLISINGKSISEIGEIDKLLADLNEGDVVTLKVYRLISSGLWGRNVSMEEKEIQIKVVMMYR